MIKIYGEPPSRASRVIWLAKEAKLEFEIVPVNILEGEHLEQSYKSLNPLAQVPTIIDGDVSLGESFAINLYLAERYGGDLWGMDLFERAAIYQWTLFAGATLEPAVAPIVINRIILPPPAADLEVAAKAEFEVLRSLSRVNSVLDGQPYLLGDRFTLADLNVASVAVNAVAGKVNISDSGPNVEPWIERCLERPDCDLTVEPPTNTSPEMLKKLAEIRQRR